MHEPSLLVLRPGALFSRRYHILRCIKAGGMGAVYEVRDEKTDTPRALKVMLPDLVDNADMRARFTLEARVCGNIRSEHVVHVTDAGVDEDTGTPFLVMELLRGEELGSMVARRGRLPHEDVVTYLHQAALALEKTHAAGIVHRDLKPENLFVTARDDGSPCLKILDFGIAKVVAQSGRGQKTKPLGTPLYMAPEQIQGHVAIGPSVDLYAVGLIAYTLLTGEPYWNEELQASPAPLPFLSKIVRGVEEPPSRRAARRGVSLPAAFDGWFFKATAPDVMERFSSASEAIRRLGEALRSALPPSGSSLPFATTARAGEATDPGAGDEPATCPETEAADQAREVVSSRSSPRPSMRRRGGIAAALLGALIVATPFLPPACVPAVPARDGTIVVAGPWIAGSAARDARRALCEALDKERQADEPRVICVALPALGAGDEQVRDEARAAGASLLTLIDGDGIAHVRQLGRLRDDEIFDRGLPRIDLSNPTDASRLAPLLRSLAHIAQIAERPQARRAERLRCKTIDPDAPRSIMLLTLITAMYAPGCRPGDVDAQRLICNDASAECSLADYLYARSLLSRVRSPEPSEEASEPVWAATVLQDAVSACRIDDLDRSRSAARQLWGSSDTCVQIAASIVAACLLSKDQDVEPIEKAWLGMIELVPDGSEAKGCLEQGGWRVLVDRAWWRAQGGRWAEAAADYEKAWDLSHEPAILPPLVEVRLRQGQTQEALRALEDLRRDASLKPDARLHEALLTWIARRQEGSATGIDLAAQRLLDLYRSFPAGQCIFNDASDKILRPLACPEGSVPCAWEIFLAPKTSSSDDKLREALSAPRREGE